MNKINVLVLEDDKIYAESIALLLNSTSDIYCPKVVYSKADFEVYFKENVADIYWIDINLLDGSGLDVVYDIKEKHPEALCLICSFRREYSMIFKAFANGADGYLLKGESNEKILSSIRELYNGGVPMSTLIAKKILNNFRKKPEEEILTSREKEVLEELSKGFKYREISEKLNVSYETVKKHIQNIYYKLEVSNKTEALNRFFNNEV
ncbi:MAG TPA: response regulator transcription factor [Flavobacterium sp.]|nr:response regulator transcription factor [Flavobacterium sp.]